MTLLTILSLNWASSSTVIVVPGEAPRTTKTLAYYLAKIPPENATDQNFMAEVQLVMQPFVDAQALVSSLPSLFDLDVAIGVQLDATGAWIGQSREIPIPILNPWFSWDTNNLGWDQGYWQGPNEGVGLSSLDDDTYRRLLYAVRLSNSCDGTLGEIQAVLSEYFVTSGTNVFVVDQTNLPSGSWPAASLSMAIVVSGTLPNIVDLSLLEQVLAPRIQPAGVDIDWGVTTVDGSPVFGWDIDNDFFGGWDEGAWGAEPDFVIENILLA